MDDRRPISQFFEYDHDEIDDILASADYARPEQALGRLAAFDERLERHIVWEEEILFPAATRLMPPLAMGPVAVMRDEHRAIRNAKKEAFHALRAGDGAAAKAAVGRMLEVLKPHNDKEEQILYPLCDQLLAGPEAEKVLAAVKVGARQ